MLFLRKYETNATSRLRFPVGSNARIAWKQCSRTVMARWRRASGRTATADTSARPPVLSAARCQFQTCPTVGSAIAAPASSSRHPTGRNARSPRRHRPSRSADAGSYIRPAATACAGRSRSPRARHCGGAAELGWHNRDNAMNASWAVCCNHERGFAQFPGMEPADTSICATLRQISHVSGGVAAKVL
jgi:hypothetical protein